MARRAVGLIGPGRGPKVCIADTYASVFFRGLPDGETVTVRTYGSDAREWEACIDQDLPETAFVEFEYGGRAQVICTVEMQ